MKKHLFLIALICTLLVGCKPDPVLPTVKTLGVTEITETSALCMGDITDNGNATITAKGFCWSTEQNPTLENGFTTEADYRRDEPVPPFYATITDLLANTTYYVRAYATNSEGTAYGENINFVTLEEENSDDNTGDDNSGDDNTGDDNTGDDNTGDDNTGDDNTGDDNTGDDNEDEIIIELPTVTDVTISEVTSNTSIISAEVLTDGGAEVTERGFYWGEKSSVEPNRVNVGEGLGNFTYQLTGLNGGTEYYVYSYAKNSVGEVVGTIAYFTTIENTPEIEYVDMGFPSGVKWATCNFGATTPEGYGEYYAWGEIETKEEYTWQNGNCLTYGKELGDISGNPEYDVVAAEWGGNWRSPRLEDMYELVTLCDWIWNGKGFNVVSRINGSYIFLPAAGFMNTLAANAAGTEGALDQGVWGYYWTTTPYSEELEGGTNTNKKACFLTFSSGGYMTDQGGRFNGFSIRPVRD